MSISLVPIPLTIYDSLTDTASIAYYTPESFIGKSLVSTASNAIVNVIKSGLSDTVPVLESPNVISYLTTTSLTGVASLLSTNAANTKAANLAVQATATAITANITYVTTADTNNTAVLLPVITKGLAYRVINNGAFVVKVFPQVGDFINALAVNLSVNVPVGGSVTFYTKNASATATANKGWFSL